MLLPIMSESRKSTITKWVVRGGVTVVVLIIIGGLVGCSTVRGVINGVESVGAGILMDARGVVNGLDDVDTPACTYDSHDGS